MGRPYLTTGWVPVPTILDEAYAGHQESMDGASTMSLRHNGGFLLFGQRHIAETKPSASDLLWWLQCIQGLV